MSLEANCRSTYVPPRQQWNEPGRASPLNPASQPAELPSPTAIGNKRASADNYYEDVDPRFAEPAAASNLSPNSAPNYARVNNPNQNLRPIQPPPMGLDGSSSYEDLHAGQRSPAESDRSNFTSVSQRGVNPRWNDGGYAPMPRRPVPQQNDILLNSNPDFMLPGGRGRGFPRGGRGGAGTVPSSAYPT